MYFSWKLPTYPSPSLALTLTSRFGQNVRFDGGVGGQFLRNIGLCPTLEDSMLFEPHDKGFGFSVVAKLARYVQTLKN